jgi:signal peptidase I
MSSDTSQSVPGSGSSGGDGEAPPAGPDESGPDEGADADGGRAKGSSFFRELPFLVLVAFGLALLIKAFLVQAFYIPSGSMQQTLELRDRVLVNKLVYDFRDIHRGEIVVFDGADSFTPETVIAPPSNALERVLRFVASAVGIGAPGEKDFIKRVIGLPGDRVACCTNGHVTVQPEGASAPVELTEPYVYEDDQMPFCAAGTGEAACPEGAEGVLVPEGRLWVMGDHRGSSADSRFHIDDANSGTIPQDEVIGRAFVVVWPLNRAGLLGVPETFDGALGALPPYGLSAVPYALGLAGALPLVALRRTAVARSQCRGGQRG